VSGRERRGPSTSSCRRIAIPRLAVVSMESDGIGGVRDSPDTRFLSVLTVGAVRLRRMLIGSIRNLFDTATQSWHSTGESRERRQGMKLRNGEQNMKIALQAVRIGLSALALGVMAAQGAQFFRIAGPVQTTIIGLSADGHITWTNSPTNATFIVQTVRSLPGQTNWVDYIQVPVTNAVTTQRIYDPSPPSGMALIPAGSFTMGNSIGDGDIYDANPTNIYVSAFYMDVNLVSYSQWQTVYIWATNHGYAFDNAGMGTAANHPVQTVDWYDMVKWCNARSEMGGLTPCYYTDVTQATVYRSGEIDLAATYVKWAANGYRLPTEAEWEKAARGGLNGLRFPWGNTISESQANYYGDTYYSYDLGPNGVNPLFYTGTPPYTYTSPVGYFAPNGYGLYDMAGNVYEWCWDWYWVPYGQPTPINPTGPGPSPFSVDRVERGGSWGEGNVAPYARCADRVELFPKYALSNTGFRCVRGS